MTNQWNNLTNLHVLIQDINEKGNKLYENSIYKQQEDKQKEEEDALMESIAPPIPIQEYKLNVIDPVVNIDMGDEMILLKNKDKKPVLKMKQASITYKDEYEPTNQSNQLTNQTNL